MYSKLFASSTHGATDIEDILEILVNKTNKWLLNEQYLYVLELFESTETYIFH
jgi:hypothetical protein